MASKILKNLLGSLLNPWMNQFLVLCAFLSMFLAMWPLSSMLLPVCEFSVLDSESRYMFDYDKKKNKSLMVCGSTFLKNHFPDKACSFSFSATVVRRYLSACINCKIKGHSLGTKIFIGQLRIYQLPSEPPPFLCAAGSKWMNGLIYIHLLVLFREDLMLLWDGFVYMQITIIEVLKK